jgi:hypothetical protein
LFTSISAASSDLFFCLQTVHRVWVTSGGAWLADAQALGAVPGLDIWHAMPALHQPPNWTLSICYEMHNMTSLDALAQVGRVSVHSVVQNLH